MLHHYIALALRNARRAPVAAAVNVLTLALGLVCFVVVYAFTAFWAGADRHFANADRIGVITTSIRLADGGFAFDDAPRTPEHLAGYLAADYPRVERVARATVIAEKATVASGERAVRRIAVAVDREFLELFALPFIAGDAAAALAAPRSVVLTQETAVQLFGAADPLGRSVLVENLVEATVAGVVEAVPEPSHLGRSSSAELTFDLLATRDVLEAIRERTEAPGTQPQAENWLQTSALTYVLLPADGSLSFDELRAQLGAFTERHVPKETRDFASLAYGIVPVTQLMGNAVDGELFLSDVGMSTASVLLLLAGLVLAVGCVNYANLATARAAARLREVGLRKALGARPAQILLQHLTEAGLVAVVAALLALAALLSLAPALTALAGADVTAALLANWRFAVVLLAAVAAVTLAAGAYPAFAVSRIEPARAVRSSRASIGPRRLAAVLVGSQFAVASFLLITVAITALQNAALQRTGLSATTDPVVIVDTTSAAADIDRETFRAELARFAQVQAVTEIASVPWASMSATVIRDSPDEAAPARTVMAHAVGFDFFEAFEFELLAGRTFGRDHGDEVPPLGSRAASGQPVIVDRAFTLQLGFPTPAAAVDKLIYSPDASGSTPQRIVGVVDDKVMLFFSLGDAALRGSIYRLRGDLPYQVVRISRDDVAAGLERIDTVWRGLAPNVAIERMFVDEIFGRVYATYLRISQVFSGLAAMAFLICLTGLFGIATLSTGRRLREIGVRKSHGASTRRILALLLASFTKPVVIANVAVWPLAFVAARAYLDTFRDPIAITPAPFLVSLAVTCGIACAAVAAQTLGAARARPAEVLRYE